MVDEAPRRRDISKLLLQHGQVGDNPALVGSFLREERKLARKIKTLDAHKKCSMSLMDSEIDHIRRTFLHSQQLCSNSIVDLSMSLIPENGSNLSDLEDIFFEDHRRQPDICKQNSTTKNLGGKNKVKVSGCKLQNFPGDFQEVHVANFDDSHLSFSNHGAHCRHSHKYFNDGRSRGKYDSLYDEKDCYQLASKDALNFSTGRSKNIHKYASDVSEKTSPNVRSCILRKPDIHQSESLLKNELASHLFSPNDAIKGKNRRSFCSSDIRKEISPTASLSNVMKPARQRSWSDSQVIKKESKPPLIDLNVNDVTKKDCHLPSFVHKSYPLHRDMGLPAGHSRVFPDANMRLRSYHSTNYSLDSLPIQNIRTGRSTLNNVNPMLFHPRFNNVSKFPVDEDNNSFEALKKCRYLRVPQRHLSPEMDGMVD